MLNVDLKSFKKKHKKKINQIIYYSKDTNGLIEIDNLINNFLNEKNSFVFESVEKGVVKGRYTIFGRNPDKVWEFNNNNCFIYKKNKKIKIKGTPKKNIEEIIEKFKFKIPKNLPPISSLLSGYFSYDIIRYIEKISNSCNDDLKIPDARILRPRTLIIHDNYQQKIYYIINCFGDEKINNYKIKFNSIENHINNLIFISNYNLNFTTDKFQKKIKVRSNISKNNFLKKSSIKFNLKKFRNNFSSILLGKKINKNVRK